MLSDETIPKINQYIFQHRYKGFLVLCNTYSHKGLLPLTGKAGVILDSIDGKKNIEEIRTIAEEHNITGDQCKQFIRRLEKFHIITCGKETNLIYPDPVKSEAAQRSIVVWLYLTNQCNFRCTYCFVAKSNEKLNPDTSEMLFRRFSEMSDRNGIRNIYLILSGGEPLLNRNMVGKVIRQAEKLSRRKHILVRIGLVTNGYMLDDKTAQFLKRHNADVNISLDGLGRFNDSTRKMANGNGTFRFIMKAIILARIYGILSSVLITVSRKNIGNLPSLVDLLLAKNIPFSLQLYKNVNDNCREQELEYDSRFVSQYKKTLKNIYAYYRKNHISESPMKHYSLLDKLNFPGIRVSEYNCMGGSNYITVTQSGMVMSCPSMESAAGSLESEDILEEVRSYDKKFFPDSSVEYIKGCSACYWKYTCAGGCKLERKYHSENNPAIHSKCKIYKELLPYLLKLESERVVSNFYHDNK